MRSVLNVRDDVGAVLDLLYQPVAGETWDEVLTFAQKGPFALSFEGPAGAITLRDITFSASSTPGAVMVGLGQNDPARLVLGPAWISARER